jgi:hypothetical protein
MSELSPHLVRPCLLAGRPFFSLLNARPVETLALVNRMLDHAAAARVGRRS